MIREELAQHAIAIGSVTNHPRNVRQGDIGAISQSLKDNGQYRPIVVQRSTGYVLAGNHTLKAAKALGWKEIAATFVDCDDDRALRILLADNRTNDLASYDDNALAELLKELATTTLALEGSMYSGDDLDDILFKAEYNHGNTTADGGTHDNSDNYYDKTIRSLILVYEEDTHKELVAKLDRIVTELDVKDYSQAVKRLIEQWK
jgi:hypothetical protein